MNKKIRYIFLLLGILFFVAIKGFAQGGFVLLENKKKDKIPFELVNNLVVVSVEVNGTPLSFLLDTGVNSTILFSLANKDSLQINDAERVRLRGLGEGGSVEAIKSQNNTLKIGNTLDVDHTLYFIFESNLNLSPRMGIAVHGILGYDFFKNFVVKINYISKKITVYKPEEYKQRKCRKCEDFDIIFHKNKPYIKASITSDSIRDEATFLVDTGSSDAFWLHNEENKIDEINKNYFKDFLGFGLSGNIYGKRSKLPEISLGKFKFKNVKVAYPEKSAIENIKLFEERDGSIGGDIMKRFSVVFNYPEKKMVLKKNANFNDPFFYNMSGLTIEHDGISPIKEISKQNFIQAEAKESEGFSNTVSIPIRDIVTFFLAPKFVVSEIREDSPAYKAGIVKDDEVISVNGTPAYNYKLYELMDLFYSKAGKRISMEINRNGENMKFKFILKEVF